jgi:hypothetical protein
MKRPLRTLIWAIFATPCPALAEGGSAERHLYEAFLHSLALLPEVVQEEEGRRFLTQYPESVYAVEVAQRLAQIKAGSSITTSSFPLRAETQLKKAWRDST